MPVCHQFHPVASRPHRLKGAESPVYDQASGNPFSEYPSPSYVAEMSKAAMDAALEDLDKFSNAADGIDEDLWHHLCHYRRLKIESEQMVSSLSINCCHSHRCKLRINYIYIYICVCVYIYTYIYIYVYIYVYIYIYIYIYMS